MEFDLLPTSGFLHAAALEDLVSVYHDNITVANVKFEEGKFTILANNTGDITGGYFHLVLEPSIFNFLANVSQATFQVAYSPLLFQAHYYESECSVLESIETYLTAVEIASYTILFLSLLNCKIIGLELFGLLQLLYIDLSTQNFLTLYSYPLAKLGLVNGPSVQFGE